MGFNAAFVTVPVMPSLWGWGFFTSLEYSAELHCECSYMKSWFEGMHLGDDLQSVLKMQNGIEEFLLWK